MTDQNALQQAIDYVLDRVRSHDAAADVIAKPQ